MSKSPHNLVFRHDLWHVRWYRLWIELGGKPPANKENLCHYMRVILFAAPFRWYFCGGGRRFIKKTMLLILLLLLVFITYQFYSDFGGGSRGLQLTGIFFGLLFVAVSIFYGVVRLALRYPTPSIVIVTIPTLFLLGWAVVEEPIIMAQIFGAIFGFAAVMTAIFIVVTWVASRLFPVRDEPPKTKSKSWGDRIWEEVVDFFKLFVTYLSTKKRGSRACPFVEFEEPANEEGS